MILRYDGMTKIAEVAGVVDGSITTAKLANRAVTSDKIDWTTLKGAPILRNIAVSDDTPNGWKSVMKGLSGQEAGHAIIWYTETGKFSTQPSQYGFCEVFWADGSDVALVWHKQNNGDWFWRSGNAYGWSAAWRNGVIDWTTMPEKVGQDRNYCLKWPNGTMVAVQRKWFSVAVKSTWGNAYNAGSGFDLDDFAQAFVDVPVSVSWLLPTVGAAWLSSGGSKFLSTTSPGGVNIMRPAPRDVVQGDICTIAIGRWK